MKKLFKLMKDYDWFEGVILSRSKELILFYYRGNKFCLYLLPSGQTQLVNFESEDVTVAYYPDDNIKIYDLLTDLNYGKGGWA